MYVVNRKGRFHMNLFLTGKGTWVQLLYLVGFGTWAHVNETYTSNSAGHQAFTYIHTRTRVHSTFKFLQGMGTRATSSRKLISIKGPSTL